MSRRHFSLEVTYLSGVQPGATRFLHALEARSGGFRAGGYTAFAVQRSADNIDRGMIPLHHNVHTFLPWFEHEDNMASNKCVSLSRHAVSLPIKMHKV